ncbi:hypothetical protein [Kordiimonas sp.]|uniref:carboxylate--amine ligase n=1 Tax=Kordiimonas sp. TaxID=1970157 RepID=UPI003A8D58B0
MSYPQHARSSSSAAAIVLGGYVNGYSIIRELHAEGVPDIWLLDYGTSLARYSNKITGCRAIDNSAKSLREALFVLKASYDRLVIFPTDDRQLENLHSLYDEIGDFCFLPFNRDTILGSLDKYTQYEFCEKLGVPYPKTRALNTTADIAALDSLTYPVLIKPNTRQDLTTPVFRSLYLESPAALATNRNQLVGFLESGTTFLASEYIPGDDTHIYAYTGYRSPRGKIIREWIGKKLTQYPDLFGVFASASNEAPEVVRSQGRALLDGMNLIGIAEPEFKLDHRDGQYKLMEINLRSMMWHRMGNLSGVKLQHAQWLDAQGMDIPPQTQDLTTIIHFVYMKHEIVNLLSRPRYARHFRQNIWGGDTRYFAIFDKTDMKPFFYDLLSLPRGILAGCLKAWLKRSKFE